MDYPEGAGSQRADRVDFDPRVRLEFRGTQLSSGMQRGTSCGSSGPTPPTAIPAIYARLEEAGYFYAIRLPANNVLREKIAHRLTRLVGRPINLR
jgi:hypothetical protein